MAAIEDVWRIVSERAVLEEAAHEGRRIVAQLEECEAACSRVFAETGNALTTGEDVYHAARSALAHAMRELTEANRRLGRLSR